MIPLSFLVGPAVGAAIGYLTNYLAVKMLFRPYTEKRLGRLRIPFTPGVIPRRRAELARALGEAVGAKLVTRQDLTALLSSSDTVDRLTDAVMQALLGTEDSSLGKRLDVLLGDKSTAAKSGVDGAITEAVVRALGEVELGSILLARGAEAIRAANPMLGMFLGDALLEQLTPAVDREIKAYLSERGHGELLPSVARQTDALLSEDVTSLLARLGAEPDALRPTVRGAVERLLGSLLPTLLDSIDLAGTVEDKINGMDVRELEALVLSVMKRELRAVVNLGAVIGFLLGFATAFF